jgi:hypothetical protein
MVYGSSPTIVVLSSAVDHAMVELEPCAIDLIRTPMIGLEPHAIELIRIPTLGF